MTRARKVRQGQICEKIWVGDLEFGLRDNGSILVRKAAREVKRACYPEAKTRGEDEGGIHARDAADRDGGLDL